MDIIIKKDFVLFFSILLKTINVSAFRFESLPDKKNRLFLLPRSPLYYSVIPLFFYR